MPVQTPFRPRFSIVLFLSGPNEISFVFPPGTGDRPAKSGFSRDTEGRAAADRGAGKPESQIKFRCVRIFHKFARKTSFVFPT